MGTPTQVCVRSCPNISAPAGRPFRCVCQIKECLPQCLLTRRVPPRLTELRAPECPSTLRIPMSALAAYLDGTEIESEPFEDPIDIETPKSPLAIAPPILLSESTPPILVPILCRTVRMAVRIPHVMSLGLSASMAEAEAMCEPALCKRFRSSYESSPSVSPPDLPSRKRYRGTSELVEDIKEEDNEEDEEIEESMDSDSDEGLTPGVEGLGMDDEGYGLDNESRGIDDKGHSVESDILGLEEEEEAVPGGQQQAALVGGLISDHAVRLEELSPALFERYDRDIGELFTRSGAVREEIFSQRQPIIDVQGDNRDLRLQLAEERCARLELAEVVNGMRRGQEPRGGA
ncbi:hypothetical protein Tco_0561555 [Tanacetum coccineum]